MTSFLNALEASLLNSVSFTLSLSLCCCFCRSRAPTLKKFLKKCSYMSKREISREKKERKKQDREKLLFFQARSRRETKIHKVVQSVFKKEVSGRCLCYAYTFTQKVLLEREIKTTHHRHTQTHTSSSRMFASSRAQVVVSPPKKVRAFIVVVSSFGFGRRLLRRGCPVDAGIFLLSCLLFAFRDCLSSSSSSSVVVWCGIERNYILFSFRDSIRLSSSRVR